MEQEVGETRLHGRHIEVVTVVTGQHDNRAIEITARGAVQQFKPGKTVQLVIQQAYTLASRFQPVDSVFAALHHGQSVTRA